MTPEEDEFYKLHIQQLASSLSRMLFIIDWGPVPPPDHSCYCGSDRCDSDCSSYAYQRNDITDAKLLLRDLYQRGWITNEHKEI